MRFSSSKVLLWIHSLCISLMFCIFIIQPALILTVAVTVSCLCRKRPDSHISFRLKEFKIETLKVWSHSGVNGPEEQLGLSTFSKKRCLYLKKLLGARQRARYLRLVRPPNPAELRKTRGKKRRETLILKSLRDLSLCVSMLLLMMCITYDSSFSYHYQLNRAIRRQFIRNHNNAFMSIREHADWWKWSQMSLLDLLYKNASAKTEQPHIMIGEPVLQKTEIADTFQSQVSIMTPTRTCGHLGCYSGSSASVGLGHTKSDAASKLKLLHSGGWLGGQTVALEVQFTLYSPAPNLFTSVTLLTEQSPTSVLLPSAKVQSVRVYHTPAVWDYVVMVCKLLYLLLSLIQLCYQVSNVGQQGLRQYWTTPCNWVEVSLLTVTLMYYVGHMHHSTIIMDTVDLLQRHNYRGHVDVSLLATCEQFLRTLRGIMIFLLTMKCVTVLRVKRTLATSATLFGHSLSSLLWPMISGLILLVAMSCLGNLLYVQSSSAVAPFLISLRTLLCLYRGLGATRSLLLSEHDVFFCGILYLSAVVWTVVVIGVVSSFVRSSRRSQRRRNFFTIAELVDYIKLRVSELTGQHRKATNNNLTEGRTYYLEEFESLVDELLLRINALSDSLDHTLPPKVHHYREDSPAFSLVLEPSSMDTQPSARSQTIVNDHRDVRDQCLPNQVETSPVSHLCRSRANAEILHQRGQIGHNSSSDTVVASDDKLKGKTCLAYLESAGKSETAHTEVMVEVLVHEEPVPDTQ